MKRLKVLSVIIAGFLVFSCSNFFDFSDAQKPFNVTFDSNGGSGTMTQQEFFRDETQALINNRYSRTGYEFAGWAKKANAAKAEYADGQEVSFGNAVTLYAQWTANNYTVKFDKNANDATGDAPAEIQATYDKEFDIPENTFAKIGYNFAGWNTKTDGSGTDYEAKSSVKNLTAEKNATVTLYAQWVDRGIHKINYELNGGNHIDTSITSFKETEDVTLGTAERTGYTFGGWYEAEDFTGNAIESWKAGEKTEDVTLYAKWNANIYTVKFEANGEYATGTMESQPFTYGIPQALNENKFIRTGYDFAGWATSANGNVTYNDKQNYSIGTEDVTLYAQWEAIKYTITYKNLENATNDNPTSYTIETETITLKDPRKTGFAFLGWYTNNSFTEKSKVTEIKKGSIGEMTLYAKWEAKVYLITYKLDGGTNAVGNPVSYTIETETITLKDPTKDNFTFVCWHSDRSKKTEIAKGLIGDIVLQAVWRDNSDFVKVPAVSIKKNDVIWEQISRVLSKRDLNIKAFGMSDHEVTRREYNEIMGSDPSTATAYDKDGNELTGDAADNNPVNYVSWYDAIVYCNKRSIKEGLTPCYKINGSTDTNSWGTVPTSSNDTWGAATCNFTANGYRLPTEAEWEWAARGGENYTYAGSYTLGDVAWCYENTKNTGTREVKTKKANGYGLYDMSGNVWEWCWDWSGNISSSTPATGASSGSYRCQRGGSWYSNDEDECKLVNQYKKEPYMRNNYNGFRVVRTAE